MKSKAQKPIILRAAMLLLLAVFTTTARATDYISDVLLIGTSSSQSDVPVGYTKINQDLNAGCGSSSYYIYLYYKKASDPATSSQVITDFILVRGTNSNPSERILHEGRIYYLAPVDGDDDFKGDLNHKAHGDYIYLYYTRAHSDDFTAVTDISFNTTQSGAVGNTDSPSTGYDLNNNADGNTRIYMHLTKAKTPVFLPEVTADYTAQDGDVLTGTLANNVKISIASGATVTLRNATINVSSSAGLTCLGNANINLYGSNTVTSTGSYPGILAGGSGTTLTINGSGSLSATGGNNAAGIGGGDGGTCGNITISGGTVYATGGTNAPGIGSGRNGTCGDITLTTGVKKVNSSKGSSAASNCIGAGNGGLCGTITVGGLEGVSAYRYNVIYEPSFCYKYTVHFDSNGGTGTMEDQDFLYSVWFDITPNAFTNNGRTFVGWATTPDGDVEYTDGYSLGKIQNVSANETVTLYAKWSQTVDLSKLTGNFTAQDGDILTGTSGGNYRIFIASGATVTLSNTTINASLSEGLTCNGIASIILEGTNTVTSRNFEGIKTNNWLTISGSGTLFVAGGVHGNSNAPGIGRVPSCSGNIIISGGTINATGNGKSPGIGGENYFGEITITTGVTSVTATKGASATYSIGGNGHNSVTIGGVETGNIVQSPVTYDPLVNYKYTVCFDSNDGGGGGYCKDFLYGIATNLPANCFELSDATFTGWNTEPNGTGTAYTDEQSVSSVANAAANATVTLYAQWIRTNETLADGTAYTWTSDMPVLTATYTKTLGSERVGKYQAWFVPFDYTITTADTEKFKFYKINMIANAPSPSVNATEDIWVFLKSVEAGTTLYANMPYVYKPKEAVTDYAFTTTNATLKARNEGAVAKMETMEDIYELYGTYENTQASQSDPFYYVNINGEISLGNSSSVEIGPYRWIIRKTGKYGNTTNYARNMHFYDLEEATSISELRVNGEEDATNTGWYDLQGRKLSQTPTQSGIYVNNGKKVFIK